MKRLFRMMAAFVDATTAMFVEFAAKAREDAREYPAREYDRGYERGVRDAIGESQTLQKFRALGVRPEQGMDHALQLAAAGADGGLVNIFAKIAASGRIDPETTRQLEHHNIRIVPDREDSTNGD
ncbi:hypothetical protein [Mycetocola saprophilus]|uniref:hypothetical protein n=1 Tax=Mycetocola saprophilus TaxID=76636 RepID=UPI0004BFA769|nr:hypothetical protein [Mycetocola saprophilus]